MPARTSRAFGPLGTARHAVNGVGFDMVRVPPGRFIDGEGADRRELLVSRPFEIGVTQVTQALWRAVVGSIPSKFSAPDRPVERVSWDDAQGFLSRLEALGFCGFRLPTEVEWVWAARCGVPTVWAGANRAKTVAVTDEWWTAPAAGLSSSSSGVFDFSGNVWEWSSDRQIDIPAAGIDARGPASGSLRVYRGGGWNYGPQNARVAYRDYSTPGFRNFFLGFRLLRTGL